MSTVGVFTYHHGPSKARLTFAIEVEPGQLEWVQRAQAIDLAERVAKTLAAPTEWYRDSAIQWVHK